MVDLNCGLYAIVYILATEVLEHFTYFYVILLKERNNKTLYRYSVNSKNPSNKNNLG